jgi:hypothetical protein
MRKIGDAMESVLSPGTAGIAKMRDHVEFDAREWGRHSSARLRALPHGTDRRMVKTSDNQHARTVQMCTGGPPCAHLRMLSRTVV